MGNKQLEIKDMELLIQYMLITVIDRTECSKEDAAIFLKYKIDETAKKVRV